MILSTKNGGILTVGMTPFAEVLQHPTDKQNKIKQEDHGCLFWCKKFMFHAVRQCFSKRFGFKGWTRRVNQGHELHEVQQQITPPERRWQCANQDTRSLKTSEEPSIQITSFWLVSLLGTLEAHKHARPSQVLGNNGQYVLSRSFQYTSQDLTTSRDRRCCVPTVLTWAFAGSQAHHKFQLVCGWLRLTHGSMLLDYHLTEVPIAMAWQTQQMPQQQMQQMPQQQMQQMPHQQQMQHQQQMVHQQQMQPQQQMQHQHPQMQHQMQDLKVDMHVD